MPGPMQPAAWRAILCILPPICGRYTEGLVDDGVGWRIVIAALQPSCNLLYCDSHSRFRFDGINTALSPAKAGDPVIPATLRGIGFPFSRE